jgi:cell wall-associated NlpC family hydrolase
VNERITGCASHRFPLRLRGVVQAALAVLVLLIASFGLTQPSPARAATASASAALTAARMRLAVWRYALRQKGKPYIWGGTGPAGYDCSGLVYASYRATGITLPRTTYGMLGSWRLVRIPKSKAQRGDLAFFGSGHVELYDVGQWTYGAEETGTTIGFHKMNAYWHPTMYFRVRA